MSNNTQAIVTASKADKPQGYPKKGDLVRVHHAVEYGKGGLPFLKVSPSDQVVAVEATYLDNPYRVRVACGDVWNVTPDAHSNNPWTTTAHV